MRPKGEAKANPGKAFERFDTLLDGRDGKRQVNVVLNSNEKNRAIVALAID